MPNRLNETELKKLYNNRWFNQLNVTFQSYILQHADYKKIEKGHFIFRSGDAFDGIYAVFEGSVRLGYIDIEGQESVAAIVSPIMWFGEISFIDGQPRSHHALCVQNCKILKLNQRCLFDLVAQYPEFWRHIAELTSQKTRHLFLELISIQTQSLQQRIAQRLWFILHGYGSHLEIQDFDVQISQEQLGQMLKSSRQSINQALQSLEQQQVIQVAFKKIKILDVKRLMQLAHQCVDPRPLKSISK